MTSAQQLALAVIFKKGDRVPCIVTWGCVAREAEIIDIGGSYILVEYESGGHKAISYTSRESCELRGLPKALREACSAVMKTNAEMRDFVDSSDARLKELLALPEAP